MRNLFVILCIALPNLLLGQPQVPRVQNYVSYIVARVKPCEQNASCLDLPKNGLSIDDQSFLIFDNLRALRLGLRQSPMSFRNKRVLIDPRKNTGVREYLLGKIPNARDLLSNTTGVAYLFNMDTTCVIKQNDNYLMLIKLQYEGININIPLDANLPYSRVRIFNKLLDFQSFSFLNPVCIPLYEVLD